MVGFGYTERPQRQTYSMDVWVNQAIAILNALNVERVDLVGNSFGGALAIAMAIRHPNRARRLILMGSVGVSFDLTYGLDAVWGYTPSVENMKKLLEVFAFNKHLVTDDLAELRYRASVAPGTQEAFSSMFPPPGTVGPNDGPSCKLP